MPHRSSTSNKPRATASPATPQSNACSSRTAPGRTAKALLEHAGRDARGLRYIMPFSTIQLHQRSAIPNYVAALVGRRFVMASETNDGTRLNESRVKALTGGDPITARFLHGEFFTFRPVAKFWLASTIARSSVTIRLGLAADPRDSVFPALRGRLHAHAGASRGTARDFGVGGPRSTGVARARPPAVGISAHATQGYQIRFPILSRVLDGGVPIGASGQVGAQAFTITTANGP